MGIPCEIIQGATGRIVELVQPAQIWLFNRKQSVSGQTSSFKLCVVVNGQEKTEAERRIYLMVDCPTPFDVVVYTVEDWQQQLQREGSFAQTVASTGQVLYG